MKPESVARLQEPLEGNSFVAREENGRIRWISFPLWYPALAFALAAVGVLRFRRQFSIRSALVCLTVVAALLGMAVAL